MQVNDSKIQEILQTLPKAKIDLGNSSAKSIDIATDILQCVICYQIPAEPHECAECNALFCFNCLSKLKPTGILVKKCPHCKLPFRFRKISKVFMSLFDNIVFRHECNQKIASPNQSTTILKPSNNPPSPRQIPQTQISHA